MNEFLTAAEIEDRFKDEWVLVEDPQTDEALDVKAGTVRCHSLDRDEVYRKAQEIEGNRFAILFLGSTPENMAFVL